MKECGKPYCDTFNIKNSRMSIGYFHTYSYELFRKIAKHGNFPVAASGEAKFFINFLAGSVPFLLFLVDEY